MQTLDLGGEWLLTDLSTGVDLVGRLPGQNYLDLEAAGVIPDPFWADNEATATKVAEHVFSYVRGFEVDRSLLEALHVELVCAGLDTLATVRLNDKVVLQADNAFRTWRVDVKDVLKPGANRIEVLFASPLPYLAAKARETKLFAVGFGAKAAYLRKPQCHYGWDWGPNLPPVGITGGIEIQAYQARLDEVRVVQEHRDDQTVTLRVAATVAGTTLDATAGEINGYTVRTMLTDPSGEPTSLTIANPQLWWCNGLGSQPLYTLTVELVAADGTVCDSVTKRVGLRTLTLETPRDEHGRNFRFVLNGVPIFAKGADWIPSDTFITRTTRADLAYYFDAAVRANMNMLRVWGGGYYESDDFYDLADERGILIWQDFAFACSEYPLTDNAFLANVKAEVHDNVTRIRHHASLALWSGNNEVFALLGLMKKPSAARHKVFFHVTLRDWVKADDDITAYWPGSPSSGEANRSALGYNHGDSHLWRVWHGMAPIESLGALPARFCSEFGLESMPERATVSRFTDAVEPSIEDPVMKVHQKSGGGNEKMLFYILSKYPEPRCFDDFIYLSQLIQAEAIREAVEGWRRRMGISNGALYWQYNDVWPTASWASLDSEKRPKALQYAARHFYAPLALSVTPVGHGNGRSREIWGVNDFPEVFEGVLDVSVATLAGEVLSATTTPVVLGATGAFRLASLPLSTLLSGHDPKDAYLSATLYDRDGRAVSARTALFTPDREAGLSDPGLQVCVTPLGEAAYDIALVATKSLARFVKVAVSGVDVRLSDQCFDVAVGHPVTIRAELPSSDGTVLTDERVSVRCLNDIAPTSKPAAFLTRLKQRLKPMNLLTGVVFKVLEVRESHGDI
ncbi:MAG: hypothetical protein LBH11_05500 [Propionibacteriaceae bacterium]|jgi:beta-mannosidase|nr:hypothetical protein [Propionibacteriaceae bacterium]